MGIFNDVHDSVVQVAIKGLVHFEKYYELMDGNDMYFIAATLHPKYKGVWLLRQLGLGARVFRFFVISDCPSGNTILP